MFGSVHPVHAQKWNTLNTGHRCPSYPTNPLPPSRHSARTHKSLSIPPKLKNFPARIVKIREFKREAIHPA